MDLCTALANGRLTLRVHPGGGAPAVNVTAGVMEELTDTLGATTGVQVHLRREFALYATYVQWLACGRKTTTIRFRPGTVELPSATLLPLYPTGDFGPRRGLLPQGLVRVRAVDYLRFGELGHEHATRDGFNGITQMTEALTTIYPGLDGSRWVSVYSIELLWFRDAQPGGADPGRAWDELGEVLLAVAAVDPSAGGPADGYRTRNALVYRAVGLAVAAGLRAGVAPDPDPQDPQFPLVAYIDLPMPAGEVVQVSWHLPAYPAAFDGHSTSEKTLRLVRWCAAWPPGRVTAGQPASAPRGAAGGPRP